MTDFYNVKMLRKIGVKLSTLSLVLIFVTCCHGNQNEAPEEYFSKFVADLWLEGADVIRIIWRDCSKKLVDVKDVIDHKEYFPKFVRCMKRKTLRALDRSLNPDVVPIADGVNLVRFELVDKSGNIMAENETSSWTEQELDEGEWRNLALQRMAKILKTHVIKFDFDNNTTLEKPEYRGRRRHHMMTMMMFGVVSIGMVLVPMGFQFLAVLGGKALLLAKMALILASIQGLKKVDSYSLDPYHEKGKIATSPLNYGFYHPYAPYDHYEKRSSNGWSSTGNIPNTPPPSMGMKDPWGGLHSNIKFDRMALASTEKLPMDLTYKTDKTKPRLFPVYPATPDTYPVFTAIDSPAPLVDLTTTPGEVQADYALELPYNGFRFQSPTPVVSS